MLEIFSCSIAQLKELSILETQQVYFLLFQNMYLQIDLIVFCKENLVFIKCSLINWWGGNQRDSYLKLLLTLQASLWECRWKKLNSLIILKHAFLLSDDLMKLFAILTSLKQFLRFLQLINCFYKSGDSLVLEASHNFIKNQQKYWI